MFINYKSNKWFLGNLFKTLKIIAYDLKIIIIIILVHFNLIIYEMYPWIIRTRLNIIFV